MGSNLHVLITFLLPMGELSEQSNIVFSFQYSLWSVMFSVCLVTVLVVAQNACSPVSIECEHMLKYNRMQFT